MLDALQPIINSRTMSSGLEAIASELRRLQREGVNRVFVKESTLSLLVPRQKTAEAVAAETVGTTGEPEAHRNSRSDLRPDLVDLGELSSEESGGRESIPAKAASKRLEAIPLPEAPGIEVPEGDAATQLAWLRGKVLNCEVCQANVSEGGQIVFGSGSPEADIFFCGDAPGAEEAMTGEPFVGKAGQLLSKIISAMDLSREEFYLTNILKWQPPHGNRPPTLDEMRFCLPYLRTQIKIIRPKVVIALGNSTVVGLLGPDPERKMGTVRGTWASFEDTPVMITFQPSYLLRNGTLKTKRLAWEDMLQVMQHCGLEISDKQQGFFLPKS